MAEKEYEDMKFLLGDYGISILESIAKGASTFETIKIISGVPISCIHGRIPVLLELGLVEVKDKKYFLTEKGQQLEDKLQQHKDY